MLHSLHFVIRNHDPSILTNSQNIADCRNAIRGLFFELVPKPDKILFVSDLYLGRSRKPSDVIRRTFGAACTRHHFPDGTKGNPIVACREGLTSFR